MESKFPEAPTIQNWLEKNIFKAEIFTVDAKLKTLAHTLSEMGAQARPCVHVGVWLKV